MKRILTIFLFLSLLLQCTAQFAVIAMYKIRKDYIARNLCENRDKPQMRCNGKCYLKKQLKKVNKNNGDSREGFTKMEKESLVYILPHNSLPEQQYTFYAVTKYVTWQKDIAKYAFVDDIFHPPSSVC